MKRFASSLAQDRAGAVAIEFALWCTLFFVVALGAFDLADLYLKRSQMGSAVSAASLQAFDQRDDVKFAELQDYVQALADKETLVVTVACNGVADSCTNYQRSCACLTRQGDFVAKQCTTQCSGSNMSSGVTAGYYLTITARDAFNPALLPKSATGTSLTQSAMVRLQ